MLLKNISDYGDQAFVLKGERYPSLNYKEAHCLAIDPRNGHVLAMQGGVDFEDSQFNRTVQATVSQDLHLNHLFIWRHLTKDFLREPLCLISR